MLTLTLVLTQAAAGAPPIDWSRTAGLVTLLGGAVGVLWIVLAPLVDRLAAWRIKAPDSALADAIRDALATPEQAPHTATWMLDVLGERHDETKGFVDRLYREENAARAEMRQTVRELQTRTADLGEAVKSVRKALDRQDEALRVLPLLQGTFAEMKQAMERMQSTMQRMEREVVDRMARVEEALARERRERDR